VEILSIFFAITGRPPNEQGSFEAGQLKNTSYYRPLDHGLSRRILALKYLCRIPEIGKMCRCAWLVL